MLVTYRCMQCKEQPDTMRAGMSATSGLGRTCLVWLHMTARWNAIEAGTWARKSRITAHTASIMDRRNVIHTHRASHAPPHSAIIMNGMLTSAESHKMLMSAENEQTKGAYSKQKYADVCRKSQYADVCRKWVISKQRLATVN